MSKLPVYSIDNTKVGDIDSASWSAVKVNTGLIFAAVQATRTNLRQGNASTKTRANIKGTNCKPYKQKGTGRARHGNEKSPLFRGGGVTFGPLPRNFKDGISKTSRRVAAMHAFALKVQEGNVIIIDDWHCSEIKTKPLAQALKNLEVHSGVLVVDAPHRQLERSVRNIPHVHVCEARRLTAYDLIGREKVLMTKTAYQQVKARVAG
jgi:large subunit ribosomal protein L4